MPHVALAKRDTSVAHQCQALDQTSQHAHCYFDKEPSATKGDNVPVANFMKPKAGYD